MSFIDHNQKPYSKTLSKFITKGLLDLRAGAMLLP